MITRQRSTGLPGDVHQAAGFCAGQCQSPRPGRCGIEQPGFCAQGPEEPQPPRSLQLPQASVDRRGEISSHLGHRLLALPPPVAPLLGLLGTVTGMIATFQAITQYGTGDPKMMADGISQALVTTVLGLVAAIPLLFLHSLVAARSKALIQLLEQQSAGLIALHLGGERRSD